MDHNNHHHHHHHNTHPPLPLGPATHPPHPPPSALSTGPSSTVHSPYAPSPAAHNGYQTGAVETAQAALSEQVTATPTPAPSANGRKRKASGVPGSRGVANLTPEQLAKKRANDREAQRAIRERTRKQIEGLEQRIKELEGQQPFQELQRVVQERDRALAECEELKERLKAVAGIVGATHPGLHGSLAANGLPSIVVKLTEVLSFADLANLTARQPPLPSQVQQPPSSHPSPQPYQPSQQHHHVYGDHHLHPSLRSPHERQSSVPSQPTSSATSPQETPGAASKTYLATSDPGTANQDQKPNFYSQGQHVAPTAQMQPPPNGDRLGLDFLLDSNQHSHHKTASPHNEVSRFASPSAQSQDKPIYLQTPSVGPSTCPLDSLLGDFLFARRRKLKEGLPVDQVLGPPYPDFCALADQNQTPERYSDCHPLSKLLIDILSKFPDLAQPPEKVGIIYVMFLTMRWLICPCQPCFDRLPIWIRPTREQIETPHGIWIDHLPWPTQRARLCLAKTPMTAVRFEEFFVPFTTTLSVNWGYDRGDVLVPSGNDSGMGQDFQLNPEFEVHLKTLSNWSVGTQFRNAYPDLVDESVRVEDRGV